MNSGVYVIRKYFYPGIKVIAIWQHSEILESPQKKQDEKNHTVSSKFSIHL